MVLFEKHKVAENRMLTLITRLLPIIVVFAAVKLIVWYVELKYGFTNPDLGEVLTILGIIIGIILALKVSFAVSKYKEANDNLDNTRALLWALGDIMVREKFSDTDKNIFIRGARDWLESYRGYLKDRNSKREMIKKFREFSLLFSIFKNYNLSEMQIALIEDWRGLMSRFMSGEDSLKTIRTPPAYDDFLWITVLIYVGGICLTYPGFTGLMIAIFAAFFFGGMQVLAADFDNPFGHEKGEIVDVDIDTPISDGQFYISDEYRKTN